MMKRSRRTLLSSKKGRLDSRTGIFRPGDWCHWDEAKETCFDASGSNNTHVSSESILDDLPNISTIIFVFVKRE